MGGSATEKSFFWQERRSRFFGKVVWQRVRGFECKIHDGKLRSWTLRFDRVELFVVVVAVLVFRSQSTILVLDWKKL